MREVSPDQLKTEVIASIEAMVAHGLASLGPGSPQVPVDALVVVCFQSAAQAPGGVGRVQLSIYSEQSWGVFRSLLWDVVESTGWTRAEIEVMLDWLTDLELACLDTAIEVVEDSEDWRLPPAVPAMKPLWRFHPLRLMALMPWGKAVATASKSGNIFTHSAMNAVMAAFQQGLGSIRMARPLRPSVAIDPNYGRAQRNYINVLVGTSGFFATGRQIFDFPPALSGMFNKTDVDDIALEHVKLPYPVVYLHFGPQEDMPLGDGWFAEGAYLSEIRNDDGDRYVNIVAVSGHASLERYLDVDQGLEPSYTLALGPEHAVMPLGDAVDLVLSNKIAQLKDEIENEPFKAQLEESIRKGEAPRGAVSVQKRNAEQELSLLMPRHESFTKILRLAINALVYINAYPDDIEAKWPAATPPSKLRELTKTKDKKDKKRVLSELEKAGFTPIHLCGQRIQAEIEKQVSTWGGRHVAMHWVRGHWRRQVHGPGRALRKLIWRMPLMRGTRNADAPEEDPAGHVYMVS